MKPYFETELGKLYYGDCLEIMKEFLNNYFDLCLTDPPYGIKRDKGFNGFGGFGGFGEPIARKRYEDDNWDQERPAKAHFEKIFNISKSCIIFGGNYFTDLIPQSNHWIFWDKIQTMPTFGDGELIYTNIKRNSVKKIIYEWNGLLNKEKFRSHPTQKPLDLIYMLLKIYSDINFKIIDPFLGSGTTAVACERLNRRWVGIEKEEKYCKIAAERIKTEVEQGKLF